MNYQLNQYIPMNEDNTEEKKVDAGAEGEQAENTSNEGSENESSPEETKTEENA